MNAEELNREQLWQRYPRLLKQMQWVAILSHGEASGALAGYLLNRKEGRIISTGGEAVTHYGGCEEVIRAAIVTRKWKSAVCYEHLPGYYDMMIEEARLVSESF